MHGQLSGPKQLALLLVTLTVLVSLGASAGSASAATRIFSNSSKIVISDASPASPYPSTINVGGFGGNVQKVAATVRSFRHTCPDDVAVLLVGPSGARSTLMGNVGGCPGTIVGPVTLTFDQAATRTLNDIDVAASGTYRPSESAPTSLSPPAPGSPYPVNLDAFNGTPANGAWQLFIEDQAFGGFLGLSSGWSLKVSGPVNSLSLAGKAKLNTRKGTGVVSVRVRDAGELTLSGNGVKTASVVVAGPGTSKLVVKPRTKARRKLNSTGKAKVPVTITFTPTGGTPNAITLRIPLRKKLTR